MEFCHVRPDSERSIAVQSILQRYHSDSAMLRREFIGYRLMARDRGRYWRLPESDWIEESSKRAADLES